MTSKKYKINEIICAGLCFVALIGFILPAISVKMDFFGDSRSMSFCVTSLIVKPESLFDGAASPQADIFNILSESMFSDVFAEIHTKLVISIGAYFMTLLLLIVNLTFMFVRKIKKSINIMLVLSLALLAYAGITILSVAKTFIQGLENSLGFLASLVNISDLIKISLGSGYWLTVIMLSCVLVIKIIFDALVKM